MSDLIQRGKQCAGAWLDFDHQTDGELVLELVAEIERLITDCEELNIKLEGQKALLKASHSENERLEARIAELEKVLLRIKTEPGDFFDWWEIAEAALKEQTDE